MLMQQRKIILMILIFLMVVLTATGCGLFGPKETPQIDPPQIPDLTATNNSTEDGSLVAGEELVLQDKVLYLLDPNGYVVPVTMKIPYTESIAKQVLTYMVKGGPVEENLPAGFSAVLPEGTTFSLDIKEGVATVDFSKEFKQYEAKDETKILDAITWALTEFPTVQKVKLQINGEPVDQMPVAGTPVGQYLSRENGINLELADNAVPGQTSAVTLYFEGESPTGDLVYFVPVTRLIPRTDDLATAALEELIKGPAQGSGLVYSLLPSTTVEKIQIENGTAVASFDESIRGFDDNGNASARGIQEIVLTLAATSGVSNVQIMVNGKADLSAESMDLSRPVAVPKQINTISF